MKVSNVIKYLLSAALAGVLLYFSFKGVQWKEFWTELEHCNWEFVLLEMLAAVFAVVFRSLRWRCLIKPFDPDMKALTTFNCVNIGYLANFAFPRIGEVVRCGFLSRRSKASHPGESDKVISFDKAVGTVLLSRTWDILSVFILIALLLAFRWKQFGTFFTHSMLEPLQQKLDISLGWIALAVLAAGTIFCVAIHHFRERNRFCGKIHGFIKGIGQGFISFLHMKGKFRFLLYTVLMWLTYWTMSMCVIWAVPQATALGWPDALFVCLVGSVAWMVPVPGGFGAYHFLVALALSNVYGLSWDSGMLCATLNHESQAVMMVIAGIISYIVEITRKNRI